MTLAELRQTWEEGLEVLVELPPGGKPVKTSPLHWPLTVVLSDEDGGYHVHFYMPLNGGWEVSADVQNGSAEEALEAIIRRNRK